MTDQKEKVMTDCANAAAALEAAIAAIGGGDEGSALEYIAVAAAELRAREAVPVGRPLVFQTEDSAWCARNHALEMVGGG